MVLLEDCKRCKKKSTLAMETGVPIGQGCDGTRLKCTVCGQKVERPWMSAAASAWNLAQQPLKEVSNVSVR